jgi:hypothetical protein
MGKPAIIVALLLIAVGHAAAGDYKQPWEPRSVRRVPVPDALPPAPCVDALFPVPVVIPVIHYLVRPDGSVRLLRPCELETLKPAPGIPARQITTEPLNRPNAP